jgi:hypothetical protein
MAIVLAAAVTAAGCGGGGNGANGPWRGYSAPGMFGFSAVWAFAPDDVWVGGPQALAHFDGTAFTQVATASTIGVGDFWGFAPDDLYAVAGTSLLHWDGAAWSAVGTGGAIAPSDLTSIWGTSGGDLWLGDSQNGHVFHWNGTAWSTGITQTVAVSDLWGVGGAPGGAVFAGGVFGFDRWSGVAWTDISDSVVSQASGIWGFGPDDVWAVGDFATLAHWDGAAWTDRLPANDPDFEEDHQSVWGAASGDVWAVGDFGAISHWNGSAWSQTQVGTFPYLPFLSKVHGSSASDIWIVGRATDPNAAPGVILHYEP